MDKACLNSKFLQNNYKQVIIKKGLCVMVSYVNYKYPTLERFDSNPEYGDKHSRSPVSSFIAKRHKAQSREITTHDKIKAGIGAITGTALPILYMMKKHKVKNPFNLKYGLSDMVVLSGSSISGGIIAGMIGEDSKTKKNKLKEGIFQILNASVPAWVVAGSLKLCETSKNFNNILGKVIAMIGGLLVGMYGAASLSNLICDPFDKVPDRKLSLLDCIANIDDALGVLVLAKLPCIDKLHVEKILPFIYSYCGYRAGKSN